MPPSLIKDLTVLMVDPRLSTMSPEEQQQHFESTFAKATFEELIKWTQDLPKEKAGFFSESLIRLFSDPRLNDIPESIRQIALKNMLLCFAYKETKEALDKLAPGITKNFLASLIESSTPTWNLTSDEITTSFNSSIDKHFSSWLNLLPEIPLKPLLLELYEQVKTGKEIDEKLVSEAFIKSQISFFSLQQWIDKKPVFSKLITLMQDRSFFQLSPKERALTLLATCIKEYFQDLGSKFQTILIKTGNQKITRRQLFTNIWKPVNSQENSNNKIKEILSRLKQPDMAPIYAKVSKSLQNNSPENQELLGSIYSIMVSEQFVNASPSQQVKILQSFIDYQIPISRRSFFTWLSLRPIIQLWKINSSDI